MCCHFSVVRKCSFRKPKPICPRLWASISIAARKGTRNCFTDCIDKAKEGKGFLYSSSISMNLVCWVLDFSLRMKLLKQTEFQSQSRKTLVCIKRLLTPPQNSSTVHEKDCPFWKTYKDYLTYWTSIINFIFLFVPVYIGNVQIVKELCS